MLELKGCLLASGASGLATLVDEEEAAPAQEALWQICSDIEDAAMEGRHACVCVPETCAFLSNESDLKEITSALLALGYNVRCSDRSLLCFTWE